MKKTSGNIGRLCYCAGFSLEGWYVTQKDTGSKMTLWIHFGKDERDGLECFTMTIL